jgi:hypothetical protein
MGSPVFLLAVPRNLQHASHAAHAVTCHMTWLVNHAIAAKHLPSLLYIFCIKNFKPSCLNHSEASFDLQRALEDFFY